MKKSALLLTFIVGLSSVLGAGLTEGNNNNSMEETLDQLIIRARSIEFDKNSSDVGGAYFFFNGQNIQNARDAHYALRFSEGKCSIETLYALYLVLQSFLLPDGQGFTPEDLNGRFAKDNFEFLKKVFSEAA